MMDQAQREAIRKKAEILTGGDLGGDGDAIVDMAAQRACAYCQRHDIPEAMEQAVAALALAIRDGDAVKSITRGDTAITYSGQSDALSLLAPFRRLGGLKEGEL